MRPTELHFHRGQKIQSTFSCSFDQARYKFFDPDTLQSKIFATGPSTAHLVVPYESFGDISAISLFANSESEGMV